MIIFALFILGLCLGSFVNALVWRIHKQSKSKAKKYSISQGRSMCPHCHHELAAKDLIPLISWLSLGGKCRYCHEPIHWQYPLVELTTSLLFVASYLFWPTTIIGTEWISLATWLVCLAGLMALIIYDIRYMLLPNRIVFPLMIVAGIGLLTFSIFSRSYELLPMAILSVLIGGGIFYLLFQASSGTWIGGGDVKLGFLLGLILVSPALSFLMLFTASLLGTLFVLPLMVQKKLGPKTRIPFGPFLIMATIIVKLFGENIIDAYTSTFL